MLTLSLTQPWACLIAVGAKKIETRSWSTKHRGWTAIHASKAFPNWAKCCCDEPPFDEALDRMGIENLGDFPLGAVIAVGNLHKCDRIIRRLDGQTFLYTQGQPITGDELAFGDFTPGRFGWVFTSVHPLPRPIPARGALGLWQWSPPAEVAAWLRERGMQP